MPRLSPTAIILLSFALIIFAGTVLLLLPVAAVGRPLSFVEALFTATSATCVTGLTVIDIGTRLTFWGQLVVLVLIQIGGLGIMTFSTFFSFLLARRLSIREREILHQTLTQYPIKDLASLLKTVFIFTILLEGIGLLVYWVRFVHQYPAAKALYLAVFHAVSAFCNAGFSLFSDSLVQYRGDWLVNLTTMFLIVWGGLGFIVVYDLWKNLSSLRAGRRFSLELHSKMVLATTGILIVSGALVFFLLENFNIFRGMPWPDRLLASLFQSITARTAGFNTLDIGGLTNASLMLLAVLMLIGASPASCGGGIKTSTFTVLMAMIAARFRNQEDVNFMNRRISQDVVSRAIVIVFFSVVIIGLFTMLLLVSELHGQAHEQTRGAYLEILFEAISAFGTVGLSTGVTPHLSTVGRLLIIALMYIGRLGPLTVALAVTGGGERRLPYRYAEDHVLVG